MFTIPVAVGFVLAFSTLLAIVVPSIGATKPGIVL